MCLFQRQGHIVQLGVDDRTNTARLGQATVMVTEFSGMCRLLIDTLRNHPRFMIETDG